jgi:hypothetical protein
MQRLQGRITLLAVFLAKAMDREAGQGARWLGKQMNIYYELAIVVCQSLIWNIMQTTTFKLQETHTLNIEIAGTSLALS